jgi:hypothetical protein
MSGEYTQHGYTIPFSLKRTGNARMETPRKNPPIGKEWEGAWNGTLEAEGARLLLTIANQPDGTASGNVFNFEDGLEIPISEIAQKDSSLRLEFKAIGGSYSGVLNSERTELAGTYTQGPLSLSLTFRRSAAAAAKK